MGTGEVVGYVVRAVKAYGKVRPSREERTFLVEDFADARERAQRYRRTLARLFRNDSVTVEEIRQ
jgi:hypothetical protein